MCADISTISPLAPKTGFPEFPEIAGVKFAIASAGVKYQGRNDVMLASLAPGSTIAGVFTRSATRAAPVLDCQAKLAAGFHSASEGAAILVNSGNANAFTGSAGDHSVSVISDAVADVLNLPAGRVFTASTGVIGEPLPHERITAILGKIAGSLRADQAEPAARAIMTTDTFPKGAVASVATGGGTVCIGGFAKGSGMIAPDMATMLVYIFTDAKIDHAVLQPMLARLTEHSFNAITVDSDTSTSDSVMVGATGQSGSQIVHGSSDARAFETALAGVMRDLAHQVVRDGEGATKFVEVAVTRAASADDAKRVAMAIANSPLVKTAIAGEDPNWGRVVMAVGKSGARADRDKLSIHFGSILVAEKGWVSPTYREQDGAAYMRQQELRIAVDLGIGDGGFTAWTCDLTHGYITINADYRS